MSAILSKVKANVWEKVAGEGFEETKIEQRDEEFDELIEFGDRILLTYNELDERLALKHVNDHSAGASVLFVGTTRNEFEGKSVQKLEYTAYSSLARKLMQKLIKDGREKFENTTDTGHDIQQSGHHQNAYNEIKRVYLAHRLGNVGTGEASILVCVSSAHRKAAFDLCEEILEEVKRQVPIWKKEIYDGTHAGLAEWKANSRSHWNKG
ncbi:hypothetical protein L7F22_053865 [Adiantum nelumboides]|nr:hypothetical protein [Adiantum nelumboides]